jgi:hypothetical protein
MRVMRVVLAGLVAIAAVVAVLFISGVVVFIGLAAYVVQLFRRRTGSAQPRPPHASNRQPAARTDDAIDVIATRLPADPPER